MITPDVLLAGRYRLLSRLGSGGHGEVWQAQDTLLARVVAVKTVRAALADNPEFAVRFQAEARSMATIDHHGVVNVFDFGIADMPGGRTPYLVMQYLDGEPLHLLLARRGRISARATMDLVAQAAEALQAAHEAGVVHRDVKPGNLMIRSDGAVVLTDFGIARTAAGHNLTASGIVLGTATYCAPEQAEGLPPTPAVDVYALGVVAYECLAGRAPFAGDNAVAIALQHLREPPPSLPGDVPDGVAEVVMRALAKSPADRWPSAAALAMTARALISGLDAAPGTGRVAGNGSADMLGTGFGPANDASEPTSDAFESTGNTSRHTGDMSDRGPVTTARSRTTGPNSGEIRNRDRDGGGGAGGGRDRAADRAADQAADRFPDRAPNRAANRAPDRDTGPAPVRRSGRGMVLVGGALAAAVATALTWYLVRAEPPKSATAAQAGTVEVPPNTAAPDPSPDLVTSTEDDDPADTPAKPEKPVTQDPSPKQDEPEERATPDTGVIVGGILHVGGSEPDEADGYQPGLVEVLTPKGRRVTSKRSEQDGFRFSLPQGGYRLRTLVGEKTCSTTTRVKPGRTTRADLKCTISEPPPAEPGGQSAAVQDDRGDAKGGPNAGEPLPYADLVSAVVRGDGKAATAEFTTAGAIPQAAPSEGNSRSTWTVSIEQDGRTAVVSLTGAKGAWTLQWAARNDKTGLPDENDQVKTAAKPVISGERVSVALAARAPLKTAPIDLARPFRIVAAGSNVLNVFHGWTDSAP